MDHNLRQLAEIHQVIKISVMYNGFFLETNHKQKSITDSMQNIKKYD